MKAKRSAETIPFLFGASQRPHLLLKGSQMGFPELFRTWFGVVKGVIRPGFATKNGKGFASEPRSSKGSFGGGSARSGKVQPTQL